MANITNVIIRTFITGQKADIFTLFSPSSLPVSLLLTALNMHFVTSILVDLVFIHG